MNLAEIISEIGHCFPARRGSLSKQFLDGAGGKQNGPYFVLSRSVDGKTKSLRVPADCVDTVKAELDRGKRLGGLMGDIWAIAEDTCLDLGSFKKKNDAQRDRVLHCRTCQSGNPGERGGFIGIEVPA